MPRRSGNRRPLSYANVTATLALFVALGGTGYAISKLPKDSVKSKQIAANAVKSSEIAAGAVGTAEVADGSLSPGDFAAGQLPVGPQGPAGGAGARGPTGPAGATGSVGPTFAAVEDDADPVANPDSPSLLTATVTTPSAGKLFVMGAFGATMAFDGPSVGCTGAAKPTVGLYVDGQPVPNTQASLASNAPQFPVTQFGVTASAFPAGAHTVTLGADCAGAETVNSSVISGNRSLGAILLGS